MNLSQMKRETDGLDAQAASFPVGTKLRRTTGEIAEIVAVDAAKGTRTARSGGVDRVATVQQLEVMVARKIMEIVR